MGESDVKIIPAKFRARLNKVLLPVKKASRYVCRWRVFWLLVFLFICSTIFYQPMGDAMVKFLANHNPPLAKLPADAKPDPETTIEYKREKLTAVRTNLQNVAGLVLRDLGLKEDSVPKPVTASASRQVVAGNVDGLLPEESEKPVQGTWDLIKKNLSDALWDYFEVLTVRVVRIGDKPVMVADNGELVPYDSTDNILRWAKEIEEASRKYDVDPAIIAAIIEQESGGRPSVVSRAGAIGLMQLMPGTARGLGVDPYDPAQNIDGGTRYFSYQYKAFGSLELALAAYNAGPGNVRNGNYLYFPETQNYIRKVPRLIEKYRQIFAEAQQNSEGSVP